MAKPNGHEQNNAVACNLFVEICVGDNLLVDFVEVSPELLAPGAPALLLSRAIPPLRTLRGSFLKLSVRLFLRKHAKSQQCVTSLPGYIRASLHPQEI